MYKIYVLQSISHGSRYVGSCIDVIKRLDQHNSGKCRYTSGRKPWKLIYCEEFKTRSESMNRERFLKSGQGRAYLDIILKDR